MGLYSIVEIQGEAKRQTLSRKVEQKQWLTHLE